MTEVALIAARFVVFCQDGSLEKTECGLFGIPMPCDGILPFDAMEKAFVLFSALPPITPENQASQAALQQIVRGGDLHSPDLEGEAGEKSLVLMGIFLRVGSL